MPGEFKSVIFGLRLPRIALGILVGAALSTAGAGFQALLRNPLADPYVLGVSSGAALGTIISLIVTPHAAGAMQGAAFIGAFATVAVVYFLGTAGRTTRQRDSAAGGNRRGVIFVRGDHVSDDDDQRAGSARDGVLADGRFAVGSEDRFAAGCILFLLISVAIGCIFTTSSDLNLMLTGEQEARHLGVNVNRGEVGGLHLRVAADRAGGFGERRDRIRGAAGAARDAHAVRD